MVWVQPKSSLLFLWPLQGSSDSCRGHAWACNSEVQDINIHWVDPWSLGEGGPWLNPFLFLPWGYGSQTASRSYRIEWAAVSFILQPGVGFYHSQATPYPPTPALLGPIPESTRRWALVSGSASDLTQTKTVTVNKYELLLMSLLIFYISLIQHIL